MENKIDLNEITDRYAGRYKKSFAASGLTTDYDDIRSEIGMALTKAMNEWSDQHNSGASFATMAAEVIKNHMIDFWRKEVRRCRRFVLKDDLPPAVIKMAEAAVAGEPGMTPGLLIREIMRSLDGEEMVVAREMIAPCDRVRATCRAAEAKFAVAPRHGRFVMAVGAVYGLPPWRVSALIKSVKKKLVWLNEIA